MKTITLNNVDIYRGNLILINNQYPLQPEIDLNLTTINDNYSDILLQSEPAIIIKEIFQKMAAHKLIVPISGYRSAIEQTERYKKSLLDNGLEYTSSYVALPYHSEHQTGLAVDLTLSKADISQVCPDFPYTKICNEFRQVASENGFIERYPQGKENTTGIIHHPWHFRYIGYPHSEIVYNKCYTLEEYIEYIKGFVLNEKHLKINKNRITYEIFYVIASENTLNITLPEHSMYQVSGNNKDGFIITLWRINNE